MCRYPVGIEWSEERHWRCNNNAHPSRHGTYDGITMHPFETVFVKASWHVGEPHLSHYTRYALCLTSWLQLSCREGLANQEYLQLARKHKVYHLCMYSTLSNRDGLVYLQHWT